MGTSTQGAELAHGTPAWHDDATVVVVGSGAAGLMAAVELAGAGVDTMVLSRGRVTDSSTDWAQGGLAAVWSDQDSPDLHVSDTLTAGAGLCAEDSVRILVNEAPAALRRLIELGAVFDKDRTGGIDLHLEGDTMPAGSCMRAGTSRATRWSARSCSAWPMPWTARCRCAKACAPSTSWWTRRAAATASVRSTHRAGSGRCGPPR
ncbi:FAD-dependent oxidoreductase [Propionibacterium freudenreichii]|uniref:FAD-dependent oxidoreductase n=1 Tax=Propionibacterium freudenreichii TaxID=1744 RepID=UPI003A4C7A54